MAETEVNTKPKFAVLGAGHGGLAMAGHLALMGFEVNLFNRSEERLWGVKATGGIRLEGEVEGFGEIKLATSNIEEAIKGVDFVMVVVPATAHCFMAEHCAPYLKDGQIVILHPGRTFGALEFKQIVRKKNPNVNVIIAETQTFIYASRVLGPGHAKIFRIKNSIPVASVRAHKIPEVLKRLRPAYSQFVPGDNIFKTSFDNIGAVFHPAISILNSGWIEDLSEFQFYVQGITRSVANVLEKVDKERVNVAEALGIRAISAREWLFLAYGAIGKTLFDAVHSNPGYRGIMAPTNLNMRYITEDVPQSLVPIASVGRKFGVNTPVINSLIELASSIIETDFWETGRTVEKLGISDMSLKELRLLSIGQGN
jgi:opine dehydrogenase